MLYIQSTIVMFQVVLFFLSFLLTIVVGFKDDSNDPLILTPYIRDGKIEEALNLSKVDPEKFLGLVSYSGFMTVKEEYNNNLFFWYFPVRRGKPEDAPLVIWLNGGPGATSLIGLFMINGPFVVSNGTLELRNITWVDSFSMLYIDNPVGAGFSFTNDSRGYTDNEEDVGSQMFSCLDQFLDMFPALRKVKLFVAGESYAGKYVPALAIQIHRRKNKEKPINLEGIAIGNGIFDPPNMMHYSELCRQLGLLDGHEIQHLEYLELTTAELANANKMIDAANAFNKTIEYIKNCSGVNIYQFDRDPSKGAPPFEGLVNRPEIRKLIHVGNVTFNFNNQLVYEKMLPDFMNSTRPFVETLLEHYRVMSYSGQLDVIIPYIASKHAYDKLEFSGREDYQNAKRKQVLNKNGKVVAYSKLGGNFLEVLVRHAGHDVSAAPETFKMLIESFVKNQY